MKNINNKARWFFRSFLKMFTFTAVLFVFQACYGMPTDADSLKSNLDTEDNLDSSAGIN